MSNSTVVVMASSAWVAGSLPSAFTAISLLIGLAFLRSVSSRVRKYTRLPMGISKLAWWVSQGSPTAGHLVGLWLEATDYVHEVLTSSSKPIIQTSILGKPVLFVDPRLETEFARHSKDMKLSQFAATVLGKTLLGLSDETLGMMMRLNMTPLYHAEFLDPEKGAALLQGAVQELEEQWDNIDTQECNLNDWLFDLSVGITAKSLWGKENPWSHVDGFMEDFRIFQATFEGLFQPLPRFTASKAYKARDSLVSKLREFGPGPNREGSLAMHHRLNVVGTLDPEWHSNPDYYNIQLLVGQAILSTIGNLTTWLVRHILADKQVLEHVRTEVTRLLLSGEGPAPMLDISAMGESCPWLIASWHEVLRLHMTGIPRQAVRDFDLSGGQHVMAGDIIVLPMSETNRDPSMWPAPEEFLPQRFIGKDGRLLASLTRKVKEYGVAGNLCPGRHYAKCMVMAIVGSFFLTVSVVAGETGLSKQAAGGGISAGFERCKDDIRVRISKRREWQGRKLHLTTANPSKIFRVW